ncbi:F0F1 ATP synthase subunit delta [Maritimibacter sp. DP4N28-5]|uniref:ATP synthase subunit delta n=1 Tax=Maritimibacter dapengensis TaxID=2836868 RepID=A0ABS6T7Z4_9RHOB|nr:F0F1 ATP synthase subunit delta [Maritimibacter dapengensis]
MDVSEPASITSGIAQRYATAVFELAKDSKKIDAVEQDLDQLETALADSDDFSGLISSPIYSRDEQAAAITSIADKMNLSDAFKGALGVMAQKRRLFILPQMIGQLRAMISEDKGEIVAEVTAAKELTKAQQDKLASALKSTVGKDVKINLAVDESLIGGLIVKVGSKMIDSSIASRLNALQNSMKEVG